MAEKALGLLAAVAGLGAGGVLAVWLVLWVSLRSSAAHAPAVTGMEISRAAVLIQQSGLVARLQDGVFDAQVPPGRVARQSPAAGFELKRGATVLLRPSLGKEAQRVGELVSLPVSLAEAELDSEGLVAGRRCEVDGQADAVVVLAQNPAAATLVAPGSSIALLVNRTPREVRFVMPDLVGTGEEDAARVIRAQGFRLAAVQRVPYAGIRAGVVLRQDPAGGGPVAATAVVGLWVSK